MVKWLYLILYLIFNFLIQEPIFCQKLSWKNYTTDHGLPGNEVYDLLQDSRGYMWFATNHGICRFNGYEFIQPVDTSNLSGTEAFLPTEDIDGNIWFSRLDGSIWKIENDTIRRWKFNDLIAPYVTKYRPVVKLHIAQNGDVWLAMYTHGFIFVSASGDVKEINKKGDDYFIVAQIGDEAISTMCFHHSFAGPSNYKRLRKFHLLYRKEGFEDSGLDFQVEIPRFNSYLEYLDVTEEESLICYGQSIFSVKNGAVVWKAKLPFFAGKVCYTLNGKILIPSRGGISNGLFMFESLQDLQIGRYSNVLTDHYVTRILEDRDGGYWASTQHAGIFYCKNPDLEIFNKETGLPADDIVCLSDDDSSDLYLGTRPASVIKFNSELNAMHIIPAPSEINREVNVIYYDKMKGEIYANEILHIYKNGDWNPVNLRNNGNHFVPGFHAKSISASPDRKSIWISSFFGFTKIELETGKVEIMGRDTSVSGTERTFSVAQDGEGQIWVSTTAGLKVWRNNRYELPSFTHPMLHYQPRNIVISDGGSMIFSLSGNGILIREANDDWLHLNINTGLVSNNIKKIYLSQDGILYACSGSGLSIISKLEDKWKITNITEKDGLPSNQVNDVVKLNGVLWLATNKGLVKLKNLPLVKAMSSPILEKLWVNNERISIQKDATFAYNENNLTIRFYTLHYRSDGKILYRFKLSGADSTFTNSSVREVNFANLSSGKYVFQVQAENESGEWGEMTEWSFKINPAWWQTAWFWAILGFILAAIIGIWYRERLKKKQHEFEISLQIKELESAAMRAQMNPHFIFNSLSSIQHFISENDKDAAISYLAKFARLVRLALHGSIDGQHSLQEEIEMLENYLALEKLRFKGKFDFSIKVDNQIDTNEVTLPPMLVQPFVENALLHGMKNKLEGGKIEISFEVNGNILLTTIKDNGPGMQEGISSFEREGHKSVGMTLTKHRLDILSEKNTQKSYQIQNLTSDTGELIGTVVVLSIPLNW